VAGYPVGGDSLSITKGIVSRVTMVRYSQGARLLGIQIDAAINPGGEGGGGWGKGRQRRQQQTHSGLSGSNIRVVLSYTASTLLSSWLRSEAGCCCTVLATCLLPVCIQSDHLPPHPPPPPPPPTPTPTTTHPGNSGGPAFADMEVGCVAGVAFSKNVGTGTDNIGYIIPWAVVDHFLSEYRDHGTHRGLVSPGFYTQPMENPAQQRYLQVRWWQRGWGGGVGGGGAACTRLSCRRGAAVVVVAGWGAVGVGSGGARVVCRNGEEGMVRSVHSLAHVLGLQHARTLLLFASAAWCRPGPTDNRSLS
jgi:hypothetical protein